MYKGEGEKERQWEYKEKGTGEGRGHQTRLSKLAIGIKNSESHSSQLKYNMTNTFTMRMSRHGGTTEHAHKFNCPFMQVIHRHHFMVCKQRCTFRFRKDQFHCQENGSTLHS